MFKGAFRGGGGGGGGGGTATILVPFAFAAMVDQASGSGVGVTYTYDSATTTFTVTFNNPQSGTSYTVVTDEEFADGTGSRYMIVKSKSTTGFEVEMFGGYGPSGDPKVIMVYAQVPTVTVGSGGSGSADLSWVNVNNSQSPFTVWGSANAVDVDMSGGDVTIQLPSAASSTGKILTVKHSLGSVSTYTLKITSAGGTIDGQAEQTISQAKSSTRISSDGTHWKVI